MKGYVYMKYFRYFSLFLVWLFVCLFSMGDIYAYSVEEIEKIYFDAMKKNDVKAIKDLYVTKSEYKEFVKINRKPKASDREIELDYKFIMSRIEPSFGRANRTYNARLKSGIDVRFGSREIEHFYNKCELYLTMPTFQVGVYNAKISKGKLKMYFTTSSQFIVKINDGYKIIGDTIVMSRTMYLFSRLCEISRFLMDYQMEQATRKGSKNEYYYKDIESYTKNLNILPLHFVAWPPKVMMKNNSLRIEISEGEIDLDDDGLLKTVWYQEEHMMRAQTYLKK